MPDEKIIEQTLQVLKTIYKSSVPSPLHVEVTKWGKQPTFRGSYSYYKVGSTPQHFDNVAKPVDNKLYWAGEHTMLEYIGCVHAAYLSGARAAQSIANSYGEKE